MTGKPSGTRSAVVTAAPVLVVVFVVALLNRLLPVLRGAGLSGVLGYDDAVYHAGAVGLVHGRMPYQDFLFLHPPGVLLALAPIAAGGRWAGETTGWEASRVAWMLMGCATSLIVAFVLLPLGRLAAVAGGCAYAIFPGAVLVERTTLVEGLANFCLAGALALLIRTLASTSAPRAGPLGRPWPVLAAVGVLLGFSTAGKIWGIVPLAVVCGYVAVVLGARAAVAIAVGAAGTITAVCLPFFLAAPREMWRMVVLNQLGRDQGSGLGSRAAEIATMGRVDHGALATGAIVAALVGLIGCSVVAWRVRPYRVIVPVLWSMVGLLLVSPIFYPHYLAILAVPAALVIGVVTGSLMAAPRRRGWRLAVVVLGCLALTLDAVALMRIRSGQPVPPALHGPVQPAPGCLTSDDPNNLLALGVVGRNIERGCDLVVDLGGYSHDLSRGQRIPRARNGAWQQVAVDYLASGHYALATRFGARRGYSPTTVAEIESWPVRLSVGDHELRQPPR